MITLCNRLSCTGCMACVNRCPRQCLSMLQDQEGFYYPQIDQERCTECGLCRKVCPILTPIRLFSAQTVFAAWGRDDFIRQCSSSGGIFTILAQEILRRHGAVAGAAFDNQMVLRHRLVRMPEQLPPLRGSKYIQSDIGMIYQAGEKLLKAGVPLLFTGTPCQIAGFRAFLTKDYEQLYTCDLICHGVPSPRFFQTYLQRLTAGAVGKLADFRFRDLEGWGYRPCLCWQDGRKFELPERSNYYLKLFLGAKNLRESCYLCPFACCERAADITLGDFWGTDLSPHPAGRSGVSMVMLNTEQGMSLFSKIKDKIIFYARDLSAAQATNRQLNHPPRRPQERGLLYRDFDRLEEAEFLRKYRLVRPLFRRILSSWKNFIIKQLTHR
ncbi:Coenzyme F420 hydrogenase/dehydrogenase, beta subunit C-terminal domain [Victivallis sp. Marseille-Q1083]|uniref:Coenzyme F420 hydrogenase/dehydrogenase, beta subunit C-terminal domain n=1 Tax=Victivallis sp. Marseille-Q1083 TaxID=2717288 RepID=UPI00158E9100|nr:Coenzyme F420 hydrogenase/dehydrogenase, beta subunit C-terminal domain [Victivallis sp. Marseille-Q1083]